MLMCSLFVFFLSSSSASVEKLVEAAAVVVDREFSSSNFLVLFESQCLPNRIRKLMPNEEDGGEDSLLKVLSQNYSMRIETSYQRRQLIDKQIILIVGNITSCFATNKFEKFGRAKLLVVLTTPGYSAVELRSIMYHFWVQKKASNGVIMGANGLEIVLHSWRPYSTNCGMDIREITLSDFIMSKTRLFHNGRGWNLHQCLIRVATADYYPYVYNLVGDKFTMGHEVEIFKILASKINFTYELLVTKPGEEMSFYPKRNLPKWDYWQVLVDHRVDVFFNGRPSYWLAHLTTDASFPYNVEELLFAVPLPYKVPNWKMPLSVMDFKSRLATLAVFLTSTIVVKFLSKLSPLKAFFSTIAIVLSVPNANIMALPSPALRTFLAFFMLSCIALSAIYLSVLYEAVTYGKQTHPVDTIDGVVKQGLTLYAHPDANTPSAQSFGFNFIWTKKLALALEHVAYQNASVFMNDISLKFALYRFYKTKDNQFYYRLLKERIGTFPISFFLWKGHPLTPAVDDLIKLLIEHGWVHYFIQSMANNELKSHKYALSEKLQKDVGYFSDNGGYITFKEFPIILWMLIACLTLSIPVLAAELLYFKFVSRKCKTK